MSRKNWTLFLCCLAQFMVILDVSIVNVALPSIRRDLGFTASDLQWVVNAYTLTFAGFLLLGGPAAPPLRGREGLTPRRGRGRPARAPEGLHRRAAAVRLRVAARRAVDLAGDARRRARRPGPGW